jgi:hypothetical protein
MDSRNAIKLKIKGFYMEDIEAKKPAGRPPRHGHNSLSLTLRELGTNEHKDEDALSILEIAAEIDAEKAARPAEGAAALAASSQDKRSPEGESSKPGAQWVWAGQEGGGRL